MRQSFVDRSPSALIVVIKLVRAKGLPPVKGLNNLCNPFVEIRLSPSDEEFGEQRHRSSNKHNTCDPEWAYNERFQFRLSNNELTSGKFMLSVQHLAPIAAPSPLCDAVLHIKHLDKTTRDKSMTLACIQPDTGVKFGSLTVEVTVMSPNEAADEQDHAIYEFQRWNGDWGGIDHFLPADPGRWGSLDGKRFGNEIDDIANPVPQGWKVKQSWCTGRTSFDPDGWEYALQFKAMFWEPENSPALCVRRRVWQRVIVRE
jgi:hypothetical protein